MREPGSRPLPSVDLRSGDGRTVNLAGDVAFLPETTTIASGSVSANPLPTLPSGSSPVTRCSPRVSRIQLFDGRHTLAVARELRSLDKLRPADPLGFEMIDPQTSGDALSVRDSILDELGLLFDEDGLERPKLSDDLVLLESDLDSLGFAVLVTRLDERLGFDPFSIMEEPVYPVTLGELIEVYEQMAPGQQVSG